LLWLELPTTSATETKPFDEARILPGKQPRPEVMGDSTVEGLGLFDQLGIECHATFKGVFRKRALAESMNREDRRFIEFLERASKRIRPTAFRSDLAGLSCQARELRVRRRLAHCAFLCLCDRYGFANSSSDSIPKLRCRGMRISHDQDVRRQEIVLDE